MDYTKIYQEALEKVAAEQELYKQAEQEVYIEKAAEEGYLAGGLGSCIAELLATEHPVPMKMIGVDDQYADTGPYEELLALYGLQGEQIAETVEHFLG